MVVEVGEIGEHVRRRIVATGARVVAPNGPLRQQCGHGRAQSGNPAVGGFDEQATQARVRGVAKHSTADVGELAGGGTVGGVTIDRYVLGRLSSEGELQFTEALGATASPPSDLAFLTTGELVVAAAFPDGERLCLYSR